MPVEAGSSPYIRSLGDVGIYRSGDATEAQPVFGAGKPLAMVAYLGCLPDRRASREDLVALLWSEQPVDAARHSLRQTIWTIRKQFGNRLISPDKSHVTLLPGVGFDRDDFVAAVERVDLEAAIGMYRRHFLDGTGSLGGVEFDHWVDGERYRLSLLLRRTAEVAIERRLAEGQTAHAVRIAEAVRQIEPGEQAFIRLVIESKLADGEVVSARVESEALSEMLRRTERPPDAATQRVLSIAKNVEPDRPPEDEPEAMVGRDEELSRLVGMWNEVRQGAHRHVRVHGPSGSGRTCILRSLAYRIRASGSRALVIHPAVEQPDIPYAAVSELVGQLAECPGALGVSPGSGSVLLGLNPVFSAQFQGAPDFPPAEENLHRRVSAVAELIVAVADENQIAIIVDGVERIDPVSRQILDAVRPRLGNAPILMVTSSGDAAHGGDRLVSLEPLPDEDMRAIMGPTELPDDMVRDLLANAHGRPGQLLSDLETLVTSGRVSRRNGTWVLNQPAPVPIRQGTMFSRERLRTAALVLLGATLGFLLGALLLN